MAALSTSASSCRSALVAAPSASAASRSSYSPSRALFLGKSLKYSPLSGSGRFSPLPVRAATTTEEATTSSVSSTPSSVSSTPTTPISSTTPTIPSDPAVTTETTAETTTFQTDELIADLKAKWDAIENKTNVYIYGGGALVALWLSATIVGAVNAVPLLPKILELVGLGYTGWFVYRYLLFKESRKELAEDIEELKSKISGAGKE